MALRICEFLDVEDLVNVCTAIPNWRWILSSRRSTQAMRRYIRSWRWLDKHLCCLLFSQASSTGDGNLLPAIEYRLKEMHYFQQYSSQSSPSSPRQLINCCLTFNADIFHFFALCKQDYYHFILRTIDICESLRSGPHLLDVINIVNYDYTAHANGYDSRVQYDEFGGRKFKGNILNYDCYVFLMDPELISKHQMLQFLNAIKPHQVLIIAILPRSWDEVVNDMHVFAKFIASFDSFADCPLATTAVNWRLCCVRRMDTGELNLEEWLQFVQYDLQFKGIGSRLKDVSTPSMY
ncbi:hypothetical protein TSMEX_000980 [Taenia solium]|eukprot:TsM_001116200 transcript=TsM_001116200 gene=TsM_001116200